MILTFWKHTITLFCLPGVSLWGFVWSLLTIVLRWCVLSGILQRWCDILLGMSHLEVNQVLPLFMSDGDFEPQPRFQAWTDSSLDNYWIFGLPYQEISSRWRDTLSLCKCSVPHQHFFLYLDPIKYTMEATCKFPSPVPHAPPQLPVGPCHSTIGKSPHFTLIYLFLVWIHFLFLQWLTIHYRTYFDVHIILDLANHSPSSWILCSWDRLLYIRCFLTLCFRLILYLSCPRPRISHFSRLHSKIELLYTECSWNEAHLCLPNLCYQKILGMPKIKTKTFQWKIQMADFSSIPWLWR